MARRLSIWEQDEKLRLLKELDGRLFLAADGVTRLKVINANGDYQAESGVFNLWKQWPILRHLNGHYWMLPCLTPRETP